MSPLSRRNTPTTYLLACQFFMISLTLNPKHTPPHMFPFLTASVGKICNGYLLLRTHFGIQKYAKEVA